MERTEGVSSSEIRSEERKVRLGIIGDSHIAKKYIQESQFVNGLEITGVCSSDPKYFEEIPFITASYDTLLEKVDAVYIVSTPEHHYDQIKKALECGKHVLCEPPVALTEQQSQELFLLAEKMCCVLMDALKTAYATAYSRLLLLAKEGKIGEIYSVDATCTSLRSIAEDAWDSICDWGPRQCFRYSTSWGMTTNPRILFPILTMKVMTSLQKSPSFMITQLRLQQLQKASNQKVH